uniref:Uncharacterized protein n=1 Tax=Knipowitschia caucasica TaxID=637954 RepID=A0AAV2K625_KNICA
MIHPEGPAHPRSPPLTPAHPPSPPQCDGCISLSAGPWSVSLRLERPQLGGGLRPFGDATVGSLRVSDTVVSGVSGQ